MLSRQTRLQLIAFIAVTVTALGIMGVSFIGVPAMFGIDRYQVSVDLPRAAGLYPRAAVSYRGVEIGTVKRVEMTGHGARAVLSMESGTAVPANSTVQVRSTSAIGEQYVDFVPTSSVGGALRDGAVVAASRVSLAATTDELLDKVDTMLSSVPTADLQTTVNELGKAFSGRGSDLADLIDAASNFQDTADANLQPTLALLRDLKPVLRTQEQVSDDIRTYGSSIARLTGAVAASDASLRSILQNGSPLAQEATKTFDDLDPLLPTLLTDLADTGEVIQAYVPGIEHIFTVLPAAMEEMYNIIPNGTSAGGIGSKYPEGNLTFKLNVSDPPICTQGFEYAGHQRGPDDLSSPQLPSDSYCKVAHDDPRVVRGARNNPCPNDPTRRAAHAAGCGLVFQKVAARTLLDQSSLATYDPKSGVVMTPDGSTALFSQLGDGRAPTSWQDLLVGLVR